MLGNVLALTRQMRQPRYLRLYPGESRAVSESLALIGKVLHRLL